MKRFRWILLAVVVLAGLAAWWRYKHPADRAISLFREPVAYAELEEDASPPHRLVADFHYTGRGGPEDGRFTLVWFSPAHWYQKIDLPGYSETRIRDSNTEYRQTSVPYRTYASFILEQAFRMEAVYVGYVAYDLRKTPVQQKMLEGRTVDCIEEPAVTCVDGNRLILLDFLGDRFVFSPEWKGFGNHGFASETKYYKNDTLLVDAKLVELAPATKGDRELLKPPTDARALALCEPDSVPGLPETLENTPVAVGALWHERPGATDVYFMIEDDGRVSDVAAVNAPTPALARAAEAIVRRWKFRPARCIDGKPVQIDAIVSVEAAQK